MKTISVKLNDRSKYSIDLKEEYELDEFIEFFEAKIRTVKGYRLDSLTAGTSEKGTDTKGAHIKAANQKYEADC